MRGTVDAAGKAADDGHLRRGEPASQLLGHHLPIGGGPPRSDERHGWRARVTEFAFDVKHGGRIVDRLEQWRIGSILLGDNIAPIAFDCAELSLDRRGRLKTDDGMGYFRANAWNPQELPDRRL